MKHKLPLIILLIQSVLLPSAAVYAQGTSFCNSFSGTGGFTVTPSVGCVGEAIQLTTLVPNATSVSYAYHFDSKSVNRPDKNDETTDLSYIYQSPGTFTILQYGSNGPGFAFCKDFTVKETRAPLGVLTTCGNGTVSLTVTNDAIAKAYDKIQVDWGDGVVQPWTLPSGKDLIVSHQYQTPGNLPPVKIMGDYTVKVCQTSLKIRTLNSAVTPPSLAAIKILSVEMQADGTAKIIYEGMEGIVTQVLVAEGNGAFVNSQKGTTSGGPQSVSLVGLNPRNIYKFKLTSLNICGTPVESNTVSSVSLESVPTSLDERNSLAWKSYPNTADLIEYQLIRDNTVVLQTNDINYVDQNVKCGIRYVYQLVAIVKGGANDIRSYSAPIEAEPTSSRPDTINSAIVTVAADNQIETSVTLAGAGLTTSYDLVVERASGGTSNWSKISVSPNQKLSYQDKDVNTAENSYCYRFTYTNACKLSSPNPSRPVCSILLKADLANLTWTSATSFTQGTSSYDLLEVDAAGAAIDQIPKALLTSHTVDISGGAARLYKVRSYGSTGTLFSYSNVVNLIRDAIVLVPDAFTPNGDGINDSFEVKSYFTTAYNLSVFNRWGVLVFQTNDPAKGWDGSDEKGIKASGGYYIYKLEAQDIKGQTIARRGSFLLIR